MLRMHLLHYKLILAYLLVMFFLGCKKTKDINDALASSSIRVNVGIQGENSPFGSLYRPFRLLDTVPNEFQGYAKSDSVFLAFLPTIPKNVLRERFSDSLKQKVEKLNHGIYALTGFQNGERFYILDSNFNKDFSDDQTIYQNNNEPEKTGTNNLISESSYNLEVGFAEGDSIFLDNVFFEISFNNGAYGYSNPPKNFIEQLKRESVILSRITTYFTGTFETVEDSIGYDVAINPNGFKGTGVLFKRKDEIEFPKRSDVNYREYFVGDTLEFGGKHFKVKSFSRKQKTLELEALPNLKMLFGSALGSTIKNYKIELLNHENSDLKKVLNNKELLLIDFWGTWCAPCKELTPSLVELSHTHNNLSILSLAYQNDKEEIVKYVNRNKMLWNHGIIYGNAKSRRNKPKIIEELRIQSFPTFIIVDSTLTIKFRGTGKHFENLKSFVEKELCSIEN